MNDDRRLSELMSDAVADVEPRDALDAIRARTRSRPGPARRTWLRAAGGAALATAAVVVAVALAGGWLRPDPGPDGPPPGSGSTPPTATSPGSPGVGEQRVTGVYFVGDTPAGPRLYREFHAVPEDTRLLAALERATQAPLDPDYRSTWPTGSFVDAGFEGVGAEGQYDVTLGDESLRERPAGMSAEEARLAVESVVFTVQAAGGAGRAPVQFRLGGNPIDQVYGVPTSEPISNGPVLDTLALVSISDPGEGARVSGSFSATGVASSFEATVPWQLRRGDTVLREGFATAEGWLDRLYPWSAEVDVSGLAAGSYTFVAMTGDPSGGAEGSGPHVDTRTVVID